MKETRNVYYFDYAPETYNYIMASRILRQSEKNLLKGIVEGKTVKELAIDNKCCDRTICRKRKIIFEKLECLLNYTNSMGDIETYYKKHHKHKKKKIKVENENITYKVYLLTFPNNKVYIGMTSTEEKTRWRDGKGYLNNEVMYDDIIKYGWYNVKKNILFKELTKEQAKQKEKEMIIHYKSHLKKYGYNRGF